MRSVPLIVSCLLALGACDSDGSDGASNTGTGSSSGDEGEAGESENPSGANSTSGPSETTGPSSAGETSQGETGVDPTGGPTTGPGESGDGETSTGGTEEPQLPPGDVESLITWLEGGEYNDWQAESAVHASTGPHFGNVRTFFNNVLFDSFEDGKGVHPIGAANVKELYGPGNSIRGWAVMIKRQEDAGQWYWFEVYDGDVLSDTVAWDVCEDCHGDGNDNVLTPWPLQ